MKIITADYILTMDKANRVIKNGAIVYDKNIIDIVENIKDLEIKYPNIKTITTKPNTVLMPGLINSHVHLEFSKNKTTLEYGNFMPWLYSVIKHRDSLIDECKENDYKEAINDMLKSGITAFGAISSYGFDLNACSQTKQKVIYFNEVIGSNQGAVDALFADFKSRLETSKEYKSNNFFPAIAIHSPYSVHPILIKHVLNIAKKENLKVTTHFMESKAERNWLDNSTGEFLYFFKELLKMEKSVTTPMEFLENFNDIDKTLFVHSIYANCDELKKIEEISGVIVHCPISNRLLGSGRLDLESVKQNKIPFLVATDGHSSNYSVNMFKEMRATLMMQYDLDIKLLSRDILRGVTINAADALNLNCGSLESGKSADFITFTLPNKVDRLEEIFLQIILHTNNVDHIYIDGERIDVL